MKTSEQHWLDWESYAFPYGYGSGEPHTVPALSRFMAICPFDGCYDFRILEAELTPVVAWLLINRLCHLNILEYGTSPRFAFLTQQGKSLKSFMGAKTIDQLVELAGSQDENYSSCAPDYCNCEENCKNPFWRSRCFEG